MKKVVDFIKKLFGGSSDSSSSTPSSGFTLIELLVVIAVIGILAAALLIAIDPIDKIRQGNDTKVVNDVRAIHDGAERVYTNTNAWPANVAGIVTAGELKVVPAAPTGYAAYPAAYPLNAAGDDWVVYGQVMSKATKAKSTAANTIGGVACTAAGNCYFVITGDKACYSVAVPVAASVCP